MATKGMKHYPSPVHRAGGWIGIVCPSCKGRFQVIHDGWLHSHELETRSCPYCYKTHKLPKRMLGIRRRHWRHHGKKSGMIPASSPTKEQPFT